MEKECYEFMSNLMVTLLGVDNLFIYDLLAKELNISRTILSDFKKGKDVYMHHYLRVVNFVMTIIQLVISVELLIKEIRLVLSEHMDLMVCVVPHDKCKMRTPVKWVAALWWEMRNR